MKLDLDKKRWTNRILLIPLSAEARKTTDAKKKKRIYPGSNRGLEKLHAHLLE
jgi:hypothetical protein